jgi:Fe-Mn family superoxide dismutase
MRELNMFYPFQLPELPYQYDALEPSIDERTMHFHHDKHHQAYVTKLNDALQKWPEGQKIDLEKILSTPAKIPEHMRATIINNGGGHWAHSMFWKIMNPGGGGEPTGVVADAIKRSFGSFKAFKDLFSTEAARFFGSGWTWLVIAPNGELAILSTLNHDLPQADDFKPLLVLDLWEHAYYLKYQNRRSGFIENWWHIVNWPHVFENYEKAIM